MNKYYSACAGSGKTTLLVRKAIQIQNERVLVTTFTDANEIEIKKKFIEAVGYTPKNVVIQTWFSFLLQHGVKPYLGSTTNVEVNGIHFVEGQSGLINAANGKYYSVGESDLEKFYFDIEGNVFTDKLAKLVVRCNENSKGLVFQRIGNIFTHIFIDESQDFSGYDLEIIKELLKLSSNVIIVGDPRQTTYKTHYSKRFLQYSDGNLTKFIESECKGLGCEVDDVNLRVSHRCNQLICEFASRLFPAMPEMISGNSIITGHDGVFLLSSNEKDEYLSRFMPLQLRYNRGIKTNPKFAAMNFGESKGLTVDRVLIYATTDFVKWMQNSTQGLAPSTRTKYYVALTRARFSVGIILDDNMIPKIQGLPRYIV